MSAAQLSPPSFTSPDEQITQIVGRLARRYPRERIALIDLETLVRNAYHEFDTAAVRTYVAGFDRAPRAPSHRRAVANLSESRNILPPGHEFDVRYGPI